MPKTYYKTCSLSFAFAEFEASCLSDRRIRATTQITAMHKKMLEETTLKRCKAILSRVKKLTKKHEFNQEFTKEVEKLSLMVNSYKGNDEDIFDKMVNCFIEFGKNYNSVINSVTQN